MNGQLLEPSEAKISALDRGVLWGYGLFETMRAYHGRVWAFDEHYARFAAGAEVIDIPLPDPGSLRDAALSVLAANSLEDAGVRITMTRGAGPEDPAADADQAPNIIVTAWPLADYAELYTNGATLVTIPGARPLSGIKTTSYVVSVAARVSARRAGADDALFVADGDRVLEASASNLFVVRGDDLVTPPLGDVLPGVTRGHVIDVAVRRGFEVNEAPLRLSDLYEADEVVLTSSLREVYPARSVDGREVRRGPVCERLRAAYRSAVDAALS